MSGEVGSWVNLPVTRHKVEDGNQVLGGPVAAGLGFGGLDERIDCLDTAVGEPGNALRRLGQCFLSVLATVLIGSRRQRRAQLYRLSRSGSACARALSAVEDFA